jgi:hypothetical protein
MFTSSQPTLALQYSLLHLQACRLLSGTYREMGLGRLSLSNSPRGISTVSLSIDQQIGFVPGFLMCSIVALIMFDMMKHSPPLKSQLILFATKALAYLSYTSYWIVLVSRSLFTFAKICPVQHLMYSQLKNWTQ